MVNYVKTRPYKQRKLTANEEKFCLELAKTGGKDQHSAYVAAGYARFANIDSERKLASRLAGKPHIRERVSFIIEEAAKKSILSVSKIIDNFQTIYEKAMADGDYTAANRAMEMVGKHRGMFVERTENLNKNMNVKSVEEVDRDIERLAEVQGLTLSKGSDTKQ